MPIVWKKLYSGIWVENYTVWVILPSKTLQNAK